jgi:predicted RNA-binding Zn-ribbon protein involved in translation (DUF1610 family)
MLLGRVTITINKTEGVELAMALQLSDEELTTILGKKLNSCPDCGTDEISAVDYDGGRTLTVEVRCHQCGGSWNEHYKFIGASGFEAGDEDELDGDKTNIEDDGGDAD